MKLQHLQPEHEALLRIGSKQLGVGYSASTEGFYLVELISDDKFRILYEIRDPTIWLVQQSITIEILGDPTTESGRFEEQ